MHLQRSGRELMWELYCGFRSLSLLHFLSRKFNIAIAHRSDLNSRNHFLRFKDLRLLKKLLILFYIRIQSINISHGYTL
ncbi:hypothetical protein pb186bvf_020243 [Paramecium bursaria]